MQPSVAECITSWLLKLVYSRDIWTAKTCTKIRESEVCGSTSYRTMVMPCLWLCCCNFTLELV